MRYVPVALTVAVRVSPVPAFLAVTVAPGMAARLSSWTRPSIVPVPVWAKPRLGAHTLTSSVSAAASPCQRLEFMSTSRVGTSLARREAAVDRREPRSNGLLWTYREVQHPSHWAVARNRRLIDFVPVTYG